MKIIKIYNNPGKNKNIILKENQRKSGIYSWINLINNKSYIGSSINLSTRFNMYYSKNILNNRINKGSSAIYSAILKYGHDNFSLQILEYCEPDKVLSREQYYMDSIKPEYNLLKVAGSRFGHKLSEKTKKMISISKRGKKNINLLRVKNLSKSVSIETREKLSLRCKGIKTMIFSKSGKFIKEFLTINEAANFLNVSDKYIRNIYTRGVSYDEYIYKFELKNTAIEVLNCNYELIKVFNNIRCASKYYDIPYNTFRNYLKSGKLYKDKFFFKRK